MNIEDNYEDNYEEMLKQAIRESLIISTPDCSNIDQEIIERDKLIGCFSFGKEKQTSNRCHLTDYQNDNSNNDNDNIIKYCQQKILNLTIISIPINEYIKNMINQELDKESNKEQIKKIEEQKIEEQKIEEQKIEKQKIEEQKIKEQEKIQHIDFIIGRGRNKLKDHLNLPLNPEILKRNIIFVDENERTNADVKKLLEDIDFTNFGICKHQDPFEEIEIRFIFDWASFYCSALYNLKRMMLRLNRKCQIIVPLNVDEKTIPCDVKRELNIPIFDIKIINDQYPLFNWDLNEDLSNMKKFKANTSWIGDLINPDQYLQIDVAFKR
jgi:hypothetical protein